MNQLIKIVKQTHHFSLTYYPDEDEWKANFIYADSEFGACYAKTPELAIKGAYEFAEVRV